MITLQQGVQGEVAPKRLNQNATCLPAKNPLPRGAALKLSNREWIRDRRRWRMRHAPFSLKSDTSGEIICWQFAQEPFILLYCLLTVGATARLRLLQCIANLVTDVCKRS